MDGDAFKERPSERGREPGQHAVQVVIFVD